MSAAEKLKALVIEDERIGSEIGSNARKRFRSQNWPLPQIVAMVEAAEKEHSFTHPGGKQQMMDWSWKPCPVCSALAALDEALS